MSTVLGVVPPILVGPAYAALVSFVPEPARQKVNAVMVTGAVTFCAYRGLTDPRP